MAQVDLSQNRALKIVSAAVKGKYAVPAICCYNVESIIASVRAAEAKKSPVIIQLFPWAVTYADGLLVHAAAEAADKASVPVAVHMDHAQTPEIVRRAADIGGFDGIMVDMSHYEKEENFAKTKELVKYCNERGIVTEAEPGRIDGGEDGVGDTADLGLSGVLTTPEQAEEFVSLGINWLAPAFGNVHGKYGRKGPQLDLDRLRSIHKQVGDRVSLVLHGAGREYFDDGKLEQVCIEAGVAKINLNDCVNDHFLDVMKEKAGKAPLTTLLEEATDRMQEAVERHMDYMGSTGKA
jgi:fructose-bisphosphate aldolase class II